MIAGVLQISFSFGVNVLKNKTAKLYLLFVANFYGLMIYIYCIYYKFTIIYGAFDFIAINVDSIAISFIQ